MVNVVAWVGPLTINALVALFLVISSFASPAVADRVYHWTDGHGVIHFSEMPPPGENLPVEVRGELPKTPVLPRPELGPEYREPAIPPRGGLFWKVDGGSSDKPSYLLGTIHVEDPRVLTLPPTAERAFAGANVFCMEIVPDLGALGTISASMMLPDGNNLESLVREPWYGRAVASLASRGIPEAAVAHMKPWAVMAMLETPAPRTGLFLDMLLYQRAKGEGKEVVGLETAEEQMAAFDSIALSDQVALFRQAVEHLEEIPERIGAMIEAYVHGDLGEIVRLAEVSMADATASARSGVEHHLIRQRNRRMVQRLRPLLDRGSAFVAVGALHLPGDAGILQLLRDSGFRVRPGIFPDP